MRSDPGGMELALPHLPQVRGLRRRRDRGSQRGDLRAAPGRRRRRRPGATRRRPSAGGGRLRPRRRAEPGGRPVRLVRESPTGLSRADGDRRAGRLRRGHRGPEGCRRGRAGGLAVDLVDLRSPPHRGRDAGIRQGRHREEPAAGVRPRRPGDQLRQGLLPGPGDRGPDRRPGARQPGPQGALVRAGHRPARRRARPGSRRQAGRGDHLGRRLSLARPSGGAGPDPDRHAAAGTVLRVAIDGEGPPAVATVRDLPFPPRA